MSSKSVSPSKTVAIMFELKGEKKTLASEKKLHGADVTDDKNSYVKRQPSPSGPGFGTEASEMENKLLHQFSS